MGTHNYIIAIDGLAGSGKSTTARLLARRLGITYIDSGAMYRAVTLAALHAKAANNSLLINNLLETLEIRLEHSDEGQRTYLNNNDVSHEIRSSEVTAYVSFVSSLPEVRKRLVAMQRAFANSESVVMDGRDIGTIVFPNADVKIYMTASIEARAQRRAAEITVNGNQSDPSEIAHTLEERDQFDQNRSESPLRKADDAIEIDTSELSINDQVEKILTILHSKNLL